MTEGGKYFINVQLENSYDVVYSVRDNGHTGVVLSSRLTALILKTTRPRLSIATVRTFVGVDPFDVGRRKDGAHLLTGLDRARRGAPLSARQLQSSVEWRWLTGRRQPLGEGEREGWQQRTKEIDRSEMRTGENARVVRERKFAGFKLTEIKPSLLTVTSISKHTTTLVSQSNTAVRGNRRCAQQVDKTSGSKHC